MTERKNMSAVEYLMQIPKADALVRKLETRVNNLRMLATDNARYLNGPIGHGQPDYDKTGTLMAEICDAEEELAEARSVEFRIREEVGKTICRIENRDAQDVIFMRYMKGMKWDEIAAQKIFSVQRVYQLRRIGIREAERIIGSGAE
ncbi:MAG: hypothetical protein IKE08_05820 [Clostridia bacterium]|nr:hypothetical protein [Clostridia bacterium]